MVNIRKIKVFGISLTLWQLLLVSAVVAELVIGGIGVAEMTVVKTRDFGIMKINEEKTRAIAYVNSTITESVNFTSNCTSPEMFQAVIRTPVGSSLNNIPFVPNGLTVINKKNDTLAVGNVTLSTRIISQGAYNCTISIDSVNTTMLTWVDDL